MGNGNVSPIHEMVEFYDKCMVNNLNNFKYTKSHGSGIEIT